MVKADENFITGQDIKRNEYLMLGWFALAWILLAVALVMLAELPQHESGDMVRGYYAWQDPVELQRGYMTPEILYSMGNNLAAVEGSVVTLMDAYGKPFASVTHPYTEILADVRQRTLVLRAKDKSGFATFRGGKEVNFYKTDTPASVIDVLSGKLLVLTENSNYYGDLHLYLQGEKVPEMTLNFRDSGYPVEACFVGAKNFDVLLLDFSQVRPRTRLQRYELSGKRVTDVFLPVDDTLTGLFSLNERYDLIYNHERVYLFDFTNEVVIHEWRGRVQEVMAENSFAVLVMQDEQGSVITTIEVKGDKWEGKHFTASNDRMMFAMGEQMLYLCAEGKLHAMDLVRGAIVATTDCSANATKLLALGAHGAYVCTTDSIKFYALR